MASVVVSGIRIYPVKGCRGIDVAQARLEERGFQHDRRWMVTNPDGTSYFDQLAHPLLATIAPHIQDNGLLLQAPGMSPLRVPFQPEQATSMRARISRSVCEVIPVGSAADAWLQDVLHTACRLVFMPETTRRAVNPDYAINQEIVSFASGYPYHLISEASVALVNDLLDTPVPLDRFRPNIVLSGAPPFAEDTWQTLRIGQQVFHLVKPCDRCAITTVDQRTGEKTGKEPLSTLARFRTTGRKVLFGQYALAEGHGLAQVGDAVEVIQTRTPAVTT